jgi:hypothetical protein
MRHNWRSGKWILDSAALDFETKARFAAYSWLDLPVPIAYLSEPAQCKFDSRLYWVQMH